MGQTLKPLEGVVDEDPVLVGLASVIVRGSSCNKKGIKQSRSGRRSLGDVDGEFSRIVWRRGRLSGGRQEVV